MSDDYLWNRSGTVDPDVARLEELLSPLAHDAPLDELHLQRRRRAPWFIVGALVAAAAAIAIYIALPGRGAATCRGDDGFAFTGIGGDVRCQGSAVASGVLPVGGELVTGKHAATLTIADIGTARLGQGTQIRLQRTDAERHQLFLERGHMHAKVIARPRLFAVATPHADVIDLGCEYDITIDANGRGELSVHDGLVELVTRSGGLVIVPAGCQAQILGDQRPGLPVCTASSAGVRAAAAAYDRGEPAALDALLAAAERQDAITLIAVAVIEDSRRTRVLERLYELSPPPDAVITVDSALADPAELATWRTDVFEIYFGLWAPKR
jgi:ferric-dicitrate binding protein FerR (iron transport regulator)